MNEKALSVLEQYGMVAEKSMRSRGGILISTGKGPKLLYECSRNDSFYEREHKVTQCVAAAGFTSIDTYQITLSGSIFSQDEQGRRYIVKNWFDGRECDTKNLDDILRAVKMLAELHRKMRGMEKDTQLLHYNNSNDMRMKFDKHTKELRLVGNYLKNKKNKNEFEMLACRVLPMFREEALNAVELMEAIPYGDRIEKARTSLELCHGGYNYHNILLSDRGGAVTNFEHVCVDCQITDLYQFMRKILEKNDWDLKLGYKMVELYNFVCPISEIDREILAVNFVYPEKFWKIMNFYYGSNKSWIPRKSIEKLEDVIAQNAKRQNFVQTLH